MRFDEWYEKMMDEIEKEYGIDCLKDDVEFKEKVRGLQRISTIDDLLRKVFILFFTCDISCEIYDEYVDLVFESLSEHVCLNNLAARVIVKMIEDCELDKDVQLGEKMISRLRIWKKDDSRYMQKVIDFMNNFMRYFDIHVYSLHSKYLPFILTWHVVFTFMGCSNKRKIKNSGFYKQFLAAIKKSTKNAIVYLYEEGDKIKLMVYIKTKSKSDTILSSMMLTEDFYDLDMMKHPCTSCEYVGECTTNKNTFCKKVGLVPIYPIRKNVMVDFLIKWRYK